jgi:predicted nucleic acid-binding protein
MKVYLDSNVVIYLIEQPPVWGPRAIARLATARANADQILASDITRLECRVGPLAKSDATMLALFDAFFAAPNVLVLPLTAAVCDRAASIRAKYGFRLGDVLNLAAAVDSGCDVFLTNDNRLSAFVDIAVEILT